MVGNDIIDIRETKRTTQWERRGFLEKLFNANEQWMILNADDPFTMVWRLWSMKESAYKVFIQAGGERFNNPKKIRCWLQGLQGEAFIGTMILKTQTLIDKKYIFTNATIGNAEVKTCVFRIAVSDREEQGAIVRKQLIKSFAENNNLESNKLSVNKTDAGVPRIYYNNNDLDISVSLTHHGEFGGYSFHKQK